MEKRLDKGASKVQISSSVEINFKMAFADPSTSGNPKKLTVADMKIMYQNSFSGNLFNE